jgi:hypothetical protein
MNAVELVALPADPRRARGKRHPLEVAPALALTAAAGARSIAVIGEWAGDVGGEVLEDLGFGRRRAPSEPTARRVPTELDADVADLLAGARIRLRRCGRRRAPSEPTARRVPTGLDADVADLLAGARMRLRRCGQRRAGGRLGRKDAERLEEPGDGQGGALGGRVDPRRRGGGGPGAG